MAADIDNPGPWSKATNNVIAPNGVTSTTSGDLVEVDTPTGTAGPGTVSVSASGTTVAGVGTTFTLSFTVGDTITFVTGSGSETHTVSAIASATSLTTDAWTGAASAVSYTLGPSAGTKFQQNGNVTFGNGISLTRSLTDNYPNFAAIFTGPTRANTVAPSATLLNGAGINAAVGATNTQNWTRVGNGLNGLSVDPNIAPGATGIITSVNGIFHLIQNLASGATITNAYGIQFSGLTATGTVTNFAGYAIAAVTQATNNTYMLLGTTTIPTGNFGIYEATSNDNLFTGHIRTGNAPPSSGTPTSCGTGSPTVIGSDTDGLITTGTAAAGCTVTFAVAYTSTPFCVVTSQTQLAAFAYAITNSTIVVTITATTGDKINYHCVAQSGG